MKDTDGRVHGLVTGLQVIAIYVTDLARARAFYEGILGFAKTSDMGPGIVLESGGVIVYLEPGREAPAADPGTACQIAPAFAADSVLATRQHLLDADVPMHGELQHPSETFAFFQCLDPDGNVIEFAGTP